MIPWTHRGTAGWCKGLGERSPRGFAPLHVVLGLAGATLLFAILAAATGPEPTSFDLLVIRSLHEPGSADPTGPPWFEAFWSDVTVLGSGSIVVLLVVIVVAYLFLARHPKTALVVLLCIGFAAISAYVLKAFFERPRPMALQALISIDNYSFPSGHSVIAAAVYPTLASMIARVLDGPKLKLYCIGVGVGTMLLIGFSRIYLGVHYATDVIAGWCIGITWSLLAWALLTKLQRSGMVEQEPLAEEVPAHDEVHG